MSELKQADVARAEVEDLKQRANELEQAEIQLRRQAVGARGPQGTAGPAGAKGDKGAQGPTGTPGRDGRDGQDGRTPSKDTLESMVIELLHEYHVLDENACPYAGPYAKK